MPRTGPTRSVRRSTAGLAIVAALAVGVSQAAVADVIDRVLAVVNGHLITLSDVRTVLTLKLVDTQKDPDVTGAALERLVDRALILDEVDRYAPPEPDRSAVDARVADVERLAPSADRAAWLASLGVSEAWLRQWLRDDLRMRSYIELRFSEIVQPTDEELENYFREHQSEFAGTPQSPSAGAQQLARDRIRDERRRVIVADWIAGLRKRAEIARPAPR